jgi:hypothetical protein
VPLKEFRVANVAILGTMPLPSIKTIELLKYFSKNRDFEYFRNMKEKKFAELKKFLSLQSEFNKRILIRPVFRAQNISKHVTYVSTIGKEKKEQTRFPRENGICKWPQGFSFTQG